MAACDVVHQRHLGLHLPSQRGIHVWRYSTEEGHPRTKVSLGGFGFISAKRTCEERPLEEEMKLEFQPTADFEA